MNFASFPVPVVSNYST